MIELTFGFTKARFFLGVDEELALRRLDSPGMARTSIQRKYSGMMNCYLMTFSQYLFCLMCRLSTRSLKLNLFSLTASSGAIAASLDRIGTQGDVQTPDAKRQDLCPETQK